MTKTLTLAAAAALATAFVGAGAFTAAARPASGPMATIRAFTAATNKLDIAGSEAAFVSGDGSIIDEFAPHVWMGPTAVKDWIASATADAKAKGDSDQTLTLGAPIRMNIEGDTAYVVTKATFTYTEKGTKMREEALWTFVLDRTEKGWLIKAWAWSGHKPKAVVDAAAAPAPKAG